MSYLEYKNKYVELAGTRSINNELMNAGMFLSGVGACFHKHNITVKSTKPMDIRIHTMFEQQSRTGKGESVDVFIPFAKSMGLDVVEQLVFTDGALVGTIDAKIAQEIRNKGIHPSDEDFRDPRIIGTLGLTDIIIFPEAVQMFKKGAYTENLREILQLALDSSGKVEKNLTGEWQLSYKCAATVIGTTYKIEEFEEILLKQGMFQRLLVMIRDYTIEERKFLNDEIIKSSRKENVTDNVDGGLEVLAKEIKEIAEKNRNKVYRLNASGEKLLLNYNHEKIDYIDNNFTGSDLELVGPFTTSIETIYLKLACVAAVLNGSKSIGAREIKETRAEIDFYFKSIVNKMLSRVSTGSYEMIRKEILDYIRDTKADKNGDYRVSRDKLMQHVIDKLHVTENFVKSVIKQMKSNKEIIVESKEKQIKIKGR